MQSAWQTPRRDSSAIAGLAHGDPAANQWLLGGNSSAISSACPDGFIKNSKGVQVLESKIDSGSVIPKPRVFSSPARDLQRLSCRRNQTLGELLPRPLTAAPGGANSPSIGPFAGQPFCGKIGSLPGTRAAGPHCGKPGKSSEQLTIQTGST